MMDTAGKLILVIEDNRDIRESTSEILELAGYNVVSTENGKIGVDLAKKRVPDLILCDVMMPDLDGYGVIYLLKNNEQTANIPFIFLTAKAERSDFRKGMDMGADDYLTKPFDDIELLNAVKTRLEKRNMIKKDIESYLSLDNLLSDARSSRLLQELSEKSRTRTFIKKQNVYNEGDSALNVYLIKSGSVRTFMIYPDGRQITTGIFNTGDFFGYDTVLLDQPFSDSAETFERSEIFLISKDDFNALIFKDRGISKRFISLLSGNVKQKQDQLLKLAYNSVRKRVADALVNLAEKFGSPILDNVTIITTRDNMAAMVGTSNETISRTLSDFRDESLIEKDGSSINILSIARLRKVRQ
jgi:DNA-binding response OmpR family regulator